MNQKSSCLLIYIPINVQAHMFVISVSNNEDLSPVVTTSNQNRKQSKTEQKHTLNDGISPFPSKSDQDRSSPYNTNAITNRKVVRIKKNIHRNITS